MKQNVNHEQELWKYWEKKLSFMLYEGVLLERGELPPSDFELEGGEFFYLNVLKIMVEQDNDFDLVYSSLCADQEKGGEWETLGKNRAIYKRVTRSFFDKHWSACKLPRENKFSTRKAAKYEENIHPTVRDNMLKMIITMAIKGYCYGPQKKRNNAVTEIEKDMIELGLKLGDDTIRALLRDASKLLPSLPE